MGLLFLIDQRLNLIAMVREVAEGMKNLRLGDAESLGDVGNGFATQVKSGDMAHRDAQVVYNRFAAANAFNANNVRMLRSDSGWHDSGPEHRH